MAITKSVESAEISVTQISKGRAEFYILGDSPLIYNRMAEKSKRELLLPKGKKTLADKAANLKHNPIEEYRNSVTRNKGDDCATRLAMPSPAFKGAMATAALDMPGAKKSEIGRLTWVEGTQIDIYGIPELLMSVVRSADMNKTPDIRTRAILPMWACRVMVTYIKPKLNATVVSHLMSGAGWTAGVGDFRQEKGKGSYGQFRIVDANDIDFKHIVKTGGRVAQDAALLRPQCHDDESRELLDFYSAEVLRLGRGKKDMLLEAADAAD